MRSLNYILGGDPQNFDDCRDKFRQGYSVKTISLDLFAKEEVIGELGLISLYGRFEWEFENLKVKYVEQLGGILSFSDTGEQTELRVRNANERLEDSLKRIERLNLNVMGKEKRFDFPLPF